MMRSGSVQHTHGMSSGTGSGARGAALTTRTDPEAQDSRQGTLTVVALVLGFWLLLLGVLLLSVTPVAGTLMATFGLFGWGGALHLLASGG